ncbi:FecCD family ABC transporter permease [Escherichia coli]
MLKDSFSSARVFMGLSLLLLALVLFGASQGALKISFDALFDEEYRDIWLNIRLPRVLLAVLVGAALATAGVIMQGLFRNPMADPGLLGVSSGSALMVGVAIVLPFSFPVVLVLYEQMVFAIAGSLVVCAIIFLITQRHRDGSMMQLLLAGIAINALCGAAIGSMMQLLLAGIAINALCGAAIGILSYIGDEPQLRQLTLWMMGNLGQAQWPTLLVASSFILPAIIATTCLAGTLNLLQLGDEEAHYLGVNVKRKRQQLLLVSSLLVGAAVSVSGIIGFIGLVIPHLIRMTTGANHRWLIPCSALAGACLLLMADTLARTLVQPAEMPVGLLTSLLGGPYFMWLILRNRRIT